MTSSDIVVGIDGSPSSQAALRWAANLARTTQWVVHAVHVLEWPIGLIGGGSRPGPVEDLYLPDSDVDASYRRGMTRVFNDVDPLPGWLFHFAVGDLRRVLVRLSENAELLVIGSREHEVSGRALAGALSHYCISHTNLPVVIVPVDYLHRVEQKVGLGAGKGHTPIER